jgi:hypothetical protein
MKQASVVIPVMIAALLGGVAGGWIRGQRPMVEAAIQPAIARADPLPSVSRESVLGELEALRGDLRSLRAELARAPWRGWAVTDGAPSSRTPVELPSRDRELDADLRREFSLLRTAVRELKQSVEEGVALEPPIPVEALRAARGLDRQAVQGFVDAWELDEDTARDGLVGASHAEVLGRFGKPFYVTDDGEWRFRGTRTVRGGPPDWFRLLFSAGVVLRVTVHRP